MSAEATARLQAFFDPNHAEFHGHSFSENRIVNEVATKVNVDVPAEVALGIAVAVLAFIQETAYRKAGVDQQRYNPSQKKPALLECLLTKEVWIAI